MFNEDELYQLLLDCKKCYYAGDPLVTDDVFDYWEDRLREMNPNHKYFDLVGTGE